MQSLSAELELLGVAVAGIAAVALGLAALLAGPGGPGRRRLALLVLLALAGAASASALLRLPGRMTAALAGLAALWALGLLLRTPHPDRLALAALRRLASPRLQALLLIAAGLGAVLAQAWWAQRELDASASGTEDLELEVARVTIEELPFSARTDRGECVGLHGVADFSAYHQTAEREAEKLRNGILILKLIRTAPPSPDCNCYGWVFTGGRFWVRDEDVDRILADNGYTPVTAPRADDLIIYRDPYGKIVHAGRVEAATRNGLVLVESKWGELGRFLHAPEHQSYSETWQFYRTERGGHVLRGVEELGPSREYPPNGTARPPQLR